MSVNEPIDDFRAKYGVLDQHFYAKLPPNEAELRMASEIATIGASSVAMLLIEKGVFSREEYDAMILKRIDDRIKSLES